MSRFNNILVATDGSALAESAFRCALELANQSKARLTILTVVQPGTDRPGNVDDISRMKSDLAGRIEEFRAVAEESGIRRVHTAVDSGLAYSRILDRAERDDIDLIVLGARGWSGVGAGLGDVASHVAKFATCTVLVVR